TKFLGASLYGTWSLIWVTIVLVTPLAVLGLQAAFTRFLAAETDTDTIRERFLSVVFTVLGAGILVSLILILCSDLFASSIIGDINSSYLVKLASFMILTQTLSQIGVTFFRTFRQMKWYSALTVAKAAAQVGLMGCFLLLGWELKGVIIAVIISDILCLAIAFFIALKQVGFQLPRFTELKSYLKYGLPLVPTSAMLWIINSSDRYMIGYFMEANDVGIYTAAYSLAHLISLFLGPLQVVLLPTVSKSYDDGEIAKTRTYLKYSLKYVMMLAIPAAFGLSILASPLLRILTTSEFTPGSIVIPFLSFGILFYGLYQVCLHVIYLVKKTCWVVRLLSVSAALNIGLNLLLIPRMGILGASMASLIAYAVLGVVTTVISLRYFKFDLGLPFIAKSVLASAVMALIIWLFNPLSITRVIISILLGAVIYSAIIFALKGFNKNELSMVKDFVSGFSIRRHDK
ncbi:MAG: flippase, partial [candidate division WOR-3 bacterium]|nr:flippase [candidate division WOR-3 bacterium]